MDLYEAIKSRYSVRSYLNKPVEQEKLDRILEAARLAPSGSNRQPWRFVVVREAEMRKKLVRACSDQTFVGHVWVSSCHRCPSQPSMGTGASVCRGRGPFARYAATILGRGG